MPFVSVVIPTWNRACVLTRAVDSVLKQTFSRLELIVVDDGSTDQTQALLNGLDDARLTIIRQERKGVSAARNTGVSSARGEYIALLDSDDYWLPRKLERQLAFAREGGFAICQTEELWIRNGVRVNPRPCHTKQAGWFLEDSLRLCLISPSCVLFTHELWEELGPFDERLPACEDYSLWLRVGVSRAVGLLPEALTVKTGGHADQLSRSIIGLDLYRIYAMLDLLDTELTPEQRNLTVVALRERARLYAGGCVKHGREEEARRVWELVRARCIV